MTYSCHQRQVLWPSLHYIIPDAPRTKVSYESNSFIQYKTVNEAFADKIVSIYKEGDVSEFLIFLDLVT
jgi:trehalose 6-phosphate synthase/phosphatase